MVFVVIFNADFAWQKSTVKTIGFLIELAMEIATGSFCQNSPKKKKLASLHSLQGKQFTKATKKLINKISALDLFSK